MLPASRTKWAPQLFVKEILIKSTTDFKSERHMLFVNSAE